MCMNKVNFSSSYDPKTDTFIGYGWKKMEVTKGDGRWKKAKFERYKSSKTNSVNRIRSTSGVSYPPGFHIFTDKSDAQNYNGRGEYIVKVAFKDVISFGTNEAGYIGGKKRLGPCVIAREMKVVEVYNISDGSLVVDFFKRG